MLFRSQVYTDARGSIGGITYSRNRAGLIARGRVKPVDPNSAAQAAARSRFADLATGFALLTAAQKLAWDNYAMLHLATNKLGDPVRLTPGAMYLAYNAPRELVSLDAIDDADTASGPSTIDEQFNYVLEATGNTVQISWTTGPAWAAIATGRLAVFVSAPNSPDRTSPVGGYRFLSETVGNVIPVTTTGALDSPFGAAAAGRKVFVKLYAVMGPTFTKSLDLLITTIAA